MQPKEPASRTSKTAWRRLEITSGSFTANAAWTACAAITCNLLRAAGCLASRFHARARGATIRADLIDVAARLARRGRGQLTLHLPQYSHRQSEWMALFEAACGPPAPGGLTSPDRSPHPHRPPGTTPPLAPSKEPGQAAEQQAARTTRPHERQNQLRQVRTWRNGTSNLRGGLRLRVGTRQPGRFLVDFPLIVSRIECKLSRDLQFASHGQRIARRDFGGNVSVPGDEFHLNLKRGAFDQYLAVRHISLPWFANTNAERSRVDYLVHLSSLPAPPCRSQL